MADMIQPHERFMREWGPGHDGGLFRGRTHDGWTSERFHAAELPLIGQSSSKPKPQVGAIFRRDIQPQL
jgi:hypothetical protein